MKRTQVLLREEQQQEIRRIARSESISAGAVIRRLMAPVTRWKPEYGDVPWIVELPQRCGLAKRSAVDLFQIRSLSTSRCIERIGRVEDAIMVRVERQLCLVFGVDTLPAGGRAE